MEQHVLIIGYVWVEPNSSAAGSRMLQLIETFHQQGWAVTFASPAQKTEKAIDLSQYNIDEAEIKLNASSFDEFITQLQPSIVVFDRFMMEEQFGWRVAEYCPNAIRILDTEDIHSLRKVRHQQLKKNKPFNTNDLLESDITKREIAAILRCDISLIISSFEMELLIHTFKIDAQILLHLPFLLPKISNSDKDKWLSFNERQHIVFIGNFFHEPNIDAALQLKTIWTSIRKQLPKVELHIYGAYVNQQIAQLHNVKERFLVKGYAKNAEEVVRHARVVLAPLRFGAGIKGKLTEAMICGTPSVTTSIGAEGMHSNLPWNGVIEDDVNTFATKAVELYTDENLWKNSQNNGVEIINCLYDKEQLAIVFIEKIEGVIKDLKQHRQTNFLGRLLQHQTLQATKYMSKWIEEKNR